MVPIKEALTFDDVTLTPQYSKVLPSDVSTKTYLSKNLHLDIPIISSAMDTVTESKMAIAIAREGGIGVIHRNLSIDRQIKEIQKVKSKGLKVGAAVGTNESEFSRVKNIIKLGVDLIVIDTAHGHSQKVADIIMKINKIKTKKTTLCAGNIATANAAKFLCKLGVDLIKVGIGPGSICTTRLVAGIGVPQLSALLDVKKGLKKNVKMISDGGIKFSGDIAKALAAGADAVMVGSLLAGTSEAPGKIIKKKGKLFKVFRGMGSVGAMNKGSADRYFQKKQKDKSKYVPEGVEGLIKYKGDAKKTLHKLVGGLRSSMGYLGAPQIKILTKNAKFVKITKAGFYESMVHSIDEVKKNSEYI
jgi:IMP dehydrogenase